VHRMPSLLNAFQVRALALSALTLVICVMGLLVLHHLATPDVGCTSADACHCHHTRTLCLCAAGSSEGEDCLDTGCNWHQQTLHHGGQCDSCSRRHCHGCNSEQSCSSADEGSTEPFCRWLAAPGVGARCAPRCSSYACDACEDQSQCSQRGLCQWYLAPMAHSLDPLGMLWGDAVNGASCRPRCDAHHCGGCLDRANCLGAASSQGTAATSATCTWDEEQAMCVPGCEAIAGKEMALKGLGCWTWYVPPQCEARLKPTHTSALPSIRVRRSSSHAVADTCRYNAARARRYAKRWLSRTTPTMRTGVPGMSRQLYVRVPTVSCCPSSTGMWSTHPPGSWTWSTPWLATC
jgi:hypothetical protein